MDSAGEIMSIESFFNKISPNAAKTLLDKLINEKYDLTIKVESRQFVKTKIISKKNETEIKIEKFNSDEHSNSPVTCLFQSGSDRYFFYSFLKTTTNDWLLAVPKEIFQLQRRDNFRMQVPIGTRYNCDIVYINGRSSKVAVDIRDMSLGGCLLSISGNASDHNIKANSEIDIYLKLDKFEFTRLPLIVKHVKFIQQQKTSSLGTSFVDPDSNTLANLQSLLLYLDRIHRGKSNE